MLLGKIGSPQWIKGLRVTNSFTQSEMARHLGVTLVTISRWENGQSRPNKLALKVLTAPATNLETQKYGAKSVHETQAQESCRKGENNATVVRDAARNREPAKAHHVCCYR